jgi:hypothetical protein
MWIVVRDRRSPSPPSLRWGKKRRTNKKDQEEIRKHVVDFRIW